MEWTGKAEIKYADIPGRLTAPNDRDAYSLTYADAVDDRFCSTYLFDGRMAAQFLCTKQSTI